MTLDPILDASAFIGLDQSFQELKNKSNDGEGGLPIPASSDPLPIGGSCCLQCREGRESLAELREAGLQRILQSDFRYFEIWDF